MAQVGYEIFENALTAQARARRNKCVCTKISTTSNGNKYTKRICYYPATKRIEKNTRTISHNNVTNLSKHSTFFDENILYLLLSENLDSSRGIAFVEFNTVEEAKQWMDITQVSAQSTFDPLNINS